MAPEKQRGPQERIGIVFVHGIGEQGAFEHLESGAASLIEALRSREKGYRITVQVNTTSDATYKAGQQTWRAENCAPVWIDICNLSDRSFKRVELREVWWADLDEKTNVKWIASFLWWGCTLWWRPSYKDSNLPGADRNMCNARERRHPLPGPGDPDDAPQAPGFLDRLQLFFFAVLFVLILPTWTLIGGLMKFFRVPTIPSARILLEYFGDVKLYGQQSRRGGPLTDIGTPPRFMIRRRFIRSLIDTALGDYNRWYVFSHSLGSVVAFNGLMEPGHSLANYIDVERWQKCRETPNLIQRLPDSSTTDVAKMMPARPAWLDDAEAVDRRVLFSKFRGLLTYGSPLDKFAVLFPATVPLNRDQAVFPQEAEWVNIYEPTDPVGGSLDFFGPFLDAVQSPGRTAIAPENHSIRCYPVALLSHIRYFGLASSGSAALADAIQKWIIRGETFNRSLVRAGARTLTSAQSSFRLLFRWAQMLIFALATVALFVLAIRVSAPQLSLTAVPLLLDDLAGLLPLPWYVSDGIVIVGVAAAIVAVLGLIGRMTIDPDLPKRRSS